MSDKQNCSGCNWLECLEDPLPHDKTPYLCREPNWGGYVDLDQPNCLGRKGSRVWAMKFSPASPATKDPDHG